MRLYLAGGETWCDTLLDLGVKHILFSFYYLRSGLLSKGVATQAMLERMRRAKRKGYRFMLDSGAFTYQDAAKHHRVPPPAAYFAEYVEFTRSYGDLFDVIVEFDVDNHVINPKTGKVYDVHQANAWINELLSEPAIQHKVMPVYQPHRGRTWFYDWLADTRSPLVGMGSSNQQGKLGSFVAQCHQFGKFAHGLAQTSFKTTTKSVNFDSVDSTTWLRADKFGGTMIWSGGQLHVLDHLHKRDRQRFRAWYEDWGLDFAKIMQDDLGENRKATIITWREMGNYFESLWATRGGKYPYLYQALVDGKTLPDRHPYLDKLEEMRRGKDEKET